MEQVNARMKSHDRQHSEGSKSVDIGPISTAYVLLASYQARAHGVNERTSPRRALTRGLQSALAVFGVSGQFTIMRGKHTTAGQGFLWRSGTLGRTMKRDPESDGRRDL